MQGIIHKSLKKLALLNYILLFLSFKKSKTKKLSTALLIAFTSFFVHLFLQVFTAQISTLSDKMWDLKLTTLDRILK